VFDKKALLALQDQLDRQPLAFGLWPLAFGLWPAAGCG
jgi:hypothetical protein